MGGEATMISERAHAAVGAGSRREEPPRAENSPRCAEGTRSPAGAPLSSKRYVHSQGSSQHPCGAVSMQGDALQVRKGASLLGLLQAWLEATLRITAPFILGL